MKRFLCLCLSLLTALSFIACAKETEQITITEEPPFLPADAEGLWELQNKEAIDPLDLPFSYLSLKENGEYEALDAYGGVLKKGSYVIEEDRVVLDGYGVDDPDAWLVFQFSEDGKALTVSDPDGILVLRRAEGDAGDLFESVDRSRWYGEWSSDLGEIAIGRGMDDGCALVALSPKEGASLSVTVIFDSSTTASCDLFTLSLEGATLTLESTAKEVLPMVGQYLPKNA